MIKCKKCGAEYKDYPNAAQEILGNDGSTYCNLCEISFNDASISDYGTARSISQIISFLGWLVVGGGVIAMFVGLSQGSRYGGGEAALIAALPGLGISVSGLFLVVAGQITRATVDNASHTKEILKIMREKS